MTLGLTSDPFCLWIVQTGGLGRHLEGTILRTAGCACSLHCACVIVMLLNLYGGLIAVPLASESCTGAMQLQYVDMITMYAAITPVLHE